MIIYCPQGSKLHTILSIYFNKYNSLSIFLKKKIHYSIFLVRIYMLLCKNLYDMSELSVKTICNFNIPILCNSLACNL